MNIEVEVPMKPSVRKFLQHTKDTLEAKHEQMEDNGFFDKNIEDVTEDEARVFLEEMDCCEWPENIYCFVKYYSKFTEDELYALSGSQVLAEYKKLRKTVYVEQHKDPKKYLEDLWM